MLEGDNPATKAFGNEGKPATGGIASAQYRLQDIILGVFNAMQVKAAGWQSEPSFTAPEKSLWLDF